MKILHIVLISVLLMFVACDSNEIEKVVSGCKIPERTVTFSSAEAIFTLFSELDYTRKQWAEGNRLVPRLYMAGIPAQWRDAAQKLTVPKKKELFFRLLAPLVLRANEVIAQDRTRLLSFEQPFAALSELDQKWLVELALFYKIIKSGTTSLTIENMAELRLRVDLIPVSLALAQGAEESGWATSRFAVLGNSLFGQWDFSGNGIKPERQRKELGNYGLARFDTPLDSVIGYMRNLNTHRAYQGLREYRAQLRLAKKDVTGYELARKLDKYSERGQKYVDGLHAIMRVNNLKPTDHAHLSSAEIIYLVHEPQ